MSATHTEPFPPQVVVEDCPAREILDRVGDAWSVLVTVPLGQRTHRFIELYRAVEGISPAHAHAHRARPAAGWTDQPYRLRHRAGRGRLRADRIRPNSARFARCPV
jgi:hypothetical protein